MPYPPSWRLVFTRKIVLDHAGYSGVSHIGILLRVRWETKSVKQQLKAIPLYKKLLCLLSTRRNETQHEERLLTDKHGLQMCSNEDCELSQLIPL